MNNTFDCKDSSYGTAPAIEPIAADGGKRVRAALESRFEIVRTVSESDIHCYYLARSLAGAEVPVSSDLVRVKVLSRSAASDRRQVELFTVEARAAASLSHKNILKTTEAEELNGVWFSAIEEKPGAETLQEYLRRKGWLDSDEALRIIQQVAGALEYAHDRGVLHLTLEAEKVLLNGEGDVFLTGFGIASTDDLAWAHQERSRRCSPRYISPEQVLGRGTDKRTDLYLLGVIIFEMLTDRAPFEAEDPVSLRLKHLSKPPQPPHMFRPNLSPAASQIVLDLLGKKPAERPATIGDLMRALEQCAVAGLLTDEQPDEPSLFSEPDPEPAAFEQDLSYWEEEPKEDLRNVDIIEEPDIEEPISIDTEGEERGPVLIEPSLLPVKDGAASSVRFVWIIVVLILGMGLFWAIRAARFQGGQNPIASNAAAETLSNDEPAAVRSETDTPKMEPESPAATKLLPSSKGPAVIETRDRSGMRGSATEVRKEGKGYEKRLSPPEKPALSPPSVSKVASDPTAPLSLPSDFKVSGPGKSVNQEPPPAPEKPIAEGPPAPKVIRRSSDVLQNTAIVRSRPVYPEEAKKEKIKGPVTVEVTINEEGSVIAARPVSGPRQLHDSALAAARRWKWLPARLDRSRARVVGTITLEFR